MASENKEFLLKIVITVGMAILMQYLEYRGFFANPEGFALNVYQRAAWYRDPAPEIITVGINDDESSTYFGGTSPLHPVAVRSLVAAIQESKPAAIGVDLITDDPRYEGVDPQRPWPDQDASRPNQADASRRAIIWVTGAFNPRVEYSPFLLRLFDQHDHVIADPRNVLARDPQELLNWGIGVYPQDEDGVLRRLPRQWYVEGVAEPFENTFAGQIARTYCRTTGASCGGSDHAHEVYLPFDREGLQANHRSVSELFHCVQAVSNVCQTWRASGTREWAKTIVLIGGDFRDMNDWHRTPIGEKTPGLFVNAAAVRAELVGPRYTRVSHSFGFFLDLVAGFAILLIFIPAWSLAKKIGMSFLLLPGAMALSYLLYWGFGQLWVSWIGMLMTGVSLHTLIEILHHDVTAKHESTPQH